MELFHTDRYTDADTATCIVFDVPSAYTLLETTIIGHYTPIHFAADNKIFRLGSKIFFISARVTFHPSKVIQGH